MTLKEVRALGLTVDFPQVSMRTLFEPVVMPRNDRSFTILNLRREVRDSTVGQFDFDPDVWGIMINWEGTSFIRSTEESNPILVIPNSALFARVGEIRVRASRGLHRSTIILWRADQLPVMTKWFSRVQTKMAVRSIATQSWSQILGSTSDPLFDLRVNSMVYSTLVSILEKPNEIDLAHLPGGLPEMIEHVANEVRLKPEAYWPVPEAAKVAGYSSHHFSRTFKSLVGYGFQGYVERRRTERAIELLRTTDDAVDTIAEKSGFGATQSMRDALKEHLGLMPSDLRLQLGK